MSAQVNVQHAIESADAALGLAGLSPNNILRVELRAACDATTALIEADKEFDTALARHNEATHYKSKAAARLFDLANEAAYRRHAALARVGGAT